MAAAWAHAPGPPAALGEQSWNLRPDVALLLLAAAGLYVLGWWRLSRRTPAGGPRTRLALALGGLGGVALALLSPLDALAERRFVAHMLQHMLLVMVAAPALLLADPLAILLWALPRPARRCAGRWLRRASAPGRAWTAMTAMPAAWLAYAAVLWLWHLPPAYDAALADPRLHDLQHLSFFLGAVLFWWPVVGPAPRHRRPAPHALRIVYLVLGAFQTAALGLLLTLAPAVLYRSYAAAAGPGALDPLADQARGGIVMWGLGGLVDMLAVLVLLSRMLGRRARDRPSGAGGGAAEGAPGPGPTAAGGEVAPRAPLCGTRRSP